MSTYITRLIAGPYHVVRDEHRGIPMGVFCRRSLAEHLDAERCLDVTKKGFDYFESSSRGRTRSRSTTSCSSRSSTPVRWRTPVR